MLKGGRGGKDGGRRRKDWAVPGLSLPEGWAQRGLGGAEGTGASGEHTSGLGGIRSSRAQCWDGSEMPVEKTGPAGSTEHLNPAWALSLLFCKVPSPPSPLPTVAKRWTQYSSTQKSEGRFKDQPECKAKIPFPIPFPPPRLELSSENVTPLPGCLPRHQSSASDGPGTGSLGLF